MFAPAAEVVDMEIGPEDDISDDDGEEEEDTGLVEDVEGAEVVVLVLVNVMSA